MSVKHGPWAILDSEDFDLLKTGRLNEKKELLDFLHEKHIVLSENNINKAAHILSERCSHITNGVTLHIVVPTLRCTNKCVYCHAKSKDENAKGYDMDEDTAKQTVDFIFDTPSNNLTIEFQGGEPLLNFDIVRYIVDYAKLLGKEKNKEIQFALVSNFAKMDKDIADFIISNRIGLNTSLDGPKEVHDKNRKYKGRGTYETVVYWIDYLLKERNYKSLSALPTPSRHSLDYPKEIVDEYIERGFDRIFIRYLNRAGFAEQDWDKIGYTADEFLDFWLKTLDYIIELNKQKVEIRERWTETILSKLINPIHGGYTCLGSPCGATLIQLAYESNGDIYSCDESRSVELFKIGNVKEQRYSDVITSEQVKTIISLSSGLMNSCDSCVWHPYCGACLVSLYNSTGSFNSNPRQDVGCLIKSGSIEQIIKKLAQKDEDTDILLGWLEKKRLIYKIK
ncbi:MAG: His-Xaa-Ser system radical SAM maturase HxsB [Candidatus Diapherotrites archaeon]|nr:His-Xaa-Ser system radical SAM maturase HxsB [Candidatus Diapherotrites archaeon]